MIIPIPFSFKNPQTAINLSWIFIALGIIVITVFNMWFLGLSLIGFSAFNLYNVKSSGNNDSKNNYNRNENNDYL